MRTYFLLGFVMIVTGAVLAETVISIDSIEDLQRIGNDPEYPLDGKYILTGDIDASATATWNDGQGFAPIGDLTFVYQGNFIITGFSGHLDGQGHKITDLQIHRTLDLTASVHDRFYVGLFRAIAPNGVVENLHLENAEITGRENVGILAGENKGLIRNCSMSGHTQATDEEWARNLGGLVGLNSGTGTIVQSGAAGTVTGTLFSNSLGGLVGTNLGIVRESVSSSAVTGSVFVGGLVGRFGGDPSFKEDLSETVSLALIACHASGPVTGKGAVGGLVGGTDSPFNTALLLEDCSATGAVMGTGDYASHIGGLVGTVSGEHTTFVRCAASGDVTGQEEVGGFIGISYSSNTTVFQCSATGNVTSEGDYCGGLVGHLDGDLVQCFATGNVTAGGKFVGGLVGFAAQGKVQDCYASGQVHGLILVGGLVGLCDYLCSVLNCYAVGAVSSEIDDVSGAGGLVGGGLAVSNSFWDVETSGQELSESGQGLDTVAMKQKATFKDAGWDFLFTWGIEEGLSYPCLQWTSPSCQGDDTLSVTIQGAAVVRAAAGKAHTFRAEVNDAVGTVSYQWFYMGTDKAAIPISGANESTYAILGVTEMDAGTYYCEVTDDHFTAASAPVALVVLDALPLSNIWTLLIVAALLALAARMKNGEFRIEN